MLDTALGVLGIVLSLVLFAVGYRQTVGAKKERIAACNQQIEKILVRRIVLEAHVPSPLEISRLIDGKARDFRVVSADLLSVAQLLNVVYTRVMESDVIPGDQRQKIFERLIPTLEESEAPDEESVGTEPNAQRGTRAALWGMAIAASLAGAFVSTLPDIAKVNFADPELLKAFSVTALASLAAIAGFAVFYKFRISQEAVPTRATEVDESAKFEEEVAATMRRLGAAFLSLPAGRIGDFLIQLNGRKYLVEVKPWASRRVPAAVVRGLSERLNRTAEQMGAEEVLIVTKFQIIGPATDAAVPRVRLLSLRQLAPYLTAAKVGSSAA